MPAAGLADIGAGDPQPLEVARSVEHPLEQLPVARLQLLLLAQGDASRGHAIGEQVADPLEVAEAENAGAGAGGGDRGVDLDPGERLGREPRKLPLQPPDLPSQLGARRPLVTADADLGPAVSVEQMRHNPAPSVDHAVSRVAATIHSASSTAIWGTPWTWIAPIAIRRVPRPTS